MGDYVLKKDQSSQLAQSALFESLASYNPDTQVEHQFTFLSDEDHLEESEKLVRKWFGKNETISEPKATYSRKLKKLLLNI